MVASIRWAIACQAGRDPVPTFWQHERVAGVRAAAADGVRESPHLFRRPQGVAQLAQTAYGSMPLVVGPRLAGIQSKRLHRARVGGHTTRMQLAQIGAIGPRRSVLAIEDAPAVLFNGACRAQEDCGGDGGDCRRPNEDSHRLGFRLVRTGLMEIQSPRVWLARTDRKGSIVGGSLPRRLWRCTRHWTLRLIDSLERNRPRSLGEPYLKNDWGGEERITPCVGRSFRTTVAADD